MGCLYCGDSHSSFDPCAEAIEAITRADMESGRDAAYWKRQAQRSRVAAEMDVERSRQIKAEGYAPAHDDSHDSGELAKAAAMLAVHHTDARVTDPDEFDSAHDPWGLIAKHGDRRRALVVAGALLIAEVERIDRATSLRAGTDSSPVSEPDKT